MVIVRLIGGLGNQLFQYAFGRRLSLLRQIPLKLDKSSFEEYKLHAYSLTPFSIQESFATPEEVERVKGTGKTGLDRKIFHLKQRLKPYYRRSVVSQPKGNAFVPAYLDPAKDNVYLAGFWQTEKYFVDIQDVIRQDLTIQLEPDRLTRRIAHEISQTESVSLHVRRGDYVYSQKVSQAFGVCSLEYYETCVGLVAQKLSNPHFFVFSDDPQWAIENLRLQYPTTFVTHNDAARNYEDLRLMSMCKHNIIANSTFSWWGAWLNPNPKKIVLAPRRWFNAARLDTSDLLPDSWIKV